jgi:hypothetical protein
MNFLSIFNPSVMAGLAMLGGIQRNRNRIPQYGVRPKLGFSNPVSVRNVLSGSRRRFGFFNQGTKDPFTSQGMEVNKAEGGFKSLTQGGKFLTQAVDFHLEFGITGGDLSDPYVYVVRKPGEMWLPDFSVQDLINDSDEMNVIRGLSSKYKVTGVRLSLDYSRMVPVDTN